MKKFSLWFLSFLILLSIPLNVFGADSKISQLPTGSPVVTDWIPFVNNAGDKVTSRAQVSSFLTTYAPLDSPTFTTTLGLPVALTNAAATTWTAIDNNASAFSIGSTGKTDIFKVITTDSSEGISTSGNIVAAGSITSSSSATPNWTFYDSDGADDNDEEAAKVLVNMETTTSGSEDGKMSLQVKHAGTEATYVDLDGKTESVTISKPLTVSVDNKIINVDPSGITAGKTLTAKYTFDQSATLELKNTGLSADSKTITLDLAATDDATYTFPAATATLAQLGANTFTAKQTMDATAGLQVGATGVLITSDDDGAIVLTGASAGYDEDLKINLDDTENTAVVESSTGVVKMSFTGISLDATVPIYSSTDATITVTGNAGIYFNGDDDAIAFNLPADPSGKTFCFRNLYAKAMTVNPDDSDYIQLGATKAAQGEAIVSTGAADELICLVGLDTSNWVSMGKAGTWAEESP